MSAAPAFSTKTVACLAGAIMIIFALSLLLSGRGGAVKGDLNGPGTYSHSAVGSITLFDMLKTLGRRVTRVDKEALAKLGPKAVLVLAEPLGSFTTADFRARIQNFDTVLLVLPKWWVRPDSGHPGWISSAVLAPAFVPQDIAQKSDGDAQIVRMPAGGSFDEHGFSSTPSISGAIQLVRSRNLTPILSIGDGTLLGSGRFEGRSIVVLADPDPISNHGIGKSDNAAFARDLFDFLGEPDRTFVFDESIHGFHLGQASTGPSFDMALRFPLGLVLVQALVGLALLGAATIGRFGAPQVPTRPIGQGKRALIANIASLIDYGGHHGESLKAYVEAVVQDTALILRAPKNLDQRGLVAWLDRTGRARGMRLACSEILNAVKEASPKDYHRLIEAAQAIHKWKEGILHGSF